MSKKETPFVTEADQTDPAKGQYSSTELPAGLIDENGRLHKTLVVREMTGHEEDILASRKVKIIERLNKVLERCVLQIGDVKQGSPNWTKHIRSLTSADRMHILREIRIASLGSDYRFKVTCPECKKQSSQSVNLNDFKISELEEPMKRTFEGKLPRSGKAYLWAMINGEIEAKIADNMNESAKTSIGMWARLLKLDGKEPNLHEVQGLSQMDRNFLKREFEKYEQKTDNKIEIVCPSCGEEFSDEIDFGQADFFFPTETSNP